MKCPFSNTETIQLKKLKAYKLRAFGECCEEECMYYINGKCKKEAKSMNQESWAKVEGYDFDYEVSTEGNVRNTTTGKILKQLNKDGNLHVHLSKNGNGISCAVHKLVALAFIPNPECHTIAYHTSDNILKNTVDNIAWGTHKDVKQQHSTPGYNVGSCVTALTLDGLYINTWSSAKQASDEMNVSDTCIRRVLSRIRNCAGNLQWAYTKSMLKPAVRLFKCKCCGVLKAKDGFDEIPKIRLYGKYKTYEKDPICSECHDYLTNDKINDLV